MELTALERNIVLQVTQKALSGCKKENNLGNRTGMVHFTMTPTAYDALKSFHQKLSERRDEAAAKKLRALAELLGDTENCPIEYGYAAPAWCQDCDREGECRTGTLQCRVALAQIEVAP
jgi:hypothetical protein